MQIKDMLPWARKDLPAESRSDDDSPIASLQREMNRVFDSFWSGAGRPFGNLPAAFATGAPRTDVVETEDGVEVTVELPGMEEKDIEVTLTDEAVTIRGEKKIERKEEKKGYYVSERSYGTVFRTVPLPSGVDSDKAEAKFRNGVLSVHLPHSAEARAKVKKVAVKSA